MPRRPRVSSGGVVFHVLNRSVGRITLFSDEDDYAAFERVLAQAQERLPMRLLGYCLMPNHWHLVVWPRRDGDLSEWMRWLTVTHTQRWHAHHHSAGTGPVYQGRFKSFPMQSSPHLLTVVRYVERNALRAGLVNKAEDWRWGSLWRWVNRRQRLEDVPELSTWPAGAGAKPRNWTRVVNRPLTKQELEAMRISAQRGRPVGSERWVARTAVKLGLESTLRPRGRPRKAEE